MVDPDREAGAGLDGAPGTHDSGAAGIDGGAGHDADAAGTPPDAAAACGPGEGLCPTTPFNNEPPSAYRCRALVDGACPAPDLIVVRRLIVDDTDGNVLDMTVQHFNATDAELEEGCIHAPGARRLLRFNFAGANQGTENMNVGRPDERDAVHWEYNAAHNHFHINGWADYRLRTLGGREVGYGHKQSFCLEDNIRLSDRSGPRQFPPPLCAMFDPATPYERRPEFGLSVGWGDEYPVGLRCQWIDLGPDDPAAPDFVGDGIYVLALSVNQLQDGRRLYRERDYDNNTATVRVEIRGNTARGCVDTAGDRCPGGHVSCDGACVP